jgi:hypothetical protein
MLLYSGGLRGYLNTRQRRELVMHVDERSDFGPEINISPMAFSVF